MATEQSLELLTPIIGDLGLLFHTIQTMVLFEATVQVEMENFLIKAP